MHNIHSHTFQLPILSQPFKTTHCNCKMHKITVSQAMVPKQFLAFTNVFFICAILYVVNVTINVYYHSSAGSVTLLYIMWIHWLLFSCSSLSASVSPTVKTAGLTNIKLNFCPTFSYLFPAESYIDTLISLWFLIQVCLRSHCLCLPPPRVRAFLVRKVWQPWFNTVGGD